MGLLKEFKEFAVKGNVIDLAVAVIIGAAFGKIVASFVKDILMPPIGILLGGVRFQDLNWVLKPEELDAAGETIAAVTINYGLFVQNVVDFVIVAFVIFMTIHGFNSFKKKKKEEAPAAPPAPPRSEVLLEEIRDLLKKD